MVIIWTTSTGHAGAADTRTLAGNRTLVAAEATDEVLAHRGPSTR